MPNYSTGLKKKFLSRIKKIDFFQLILLALPIIIGILNYSPNTWLIGWDVIMPELNFSVNTERFLFGVWQEFEGLGLMAIMQKTADLPRILVLYLLSLISPVNSLRYIYQILMLLVGPIGIYKLLQYFFNSEPQNNKYAFLGALFYLFNLGTLQNFFVPLSMFTTFWGLLPWLLLYFFKYVSSGKYWDLLIFVIISIFATPLAVTTTNFIVYFMILSLTGFVELLRTRNIKNLFIVFSAVFIVNSFWLIPFVFSTFSGTGTVINSKISQMSSEDSFSYNKEYGQIKDVAILRGFWFQNIDYSNDDRAFYIILNEWSEHISNPFINPIGYVLFLFVVIGFVYVIITRSYRVFPILLIFLICLFMLINENPPIGFIFEYIRDNFEIFKEVFRFPYTKFVVPAVFSFSILFAYGVLSTSSIVSKLPSKFETLVNAIIIGLFSAMLIVWMIPVFQGKLFYKNLKVSLPYEYIETFDYFENEPQNKRIANLPQHTFWGWNYYKWGARGSGFLWYGIKQPILDRAFDVWNFKNEQYYNELHYAIYTENIDRIEKLADKYQIDYFIIDENVFVPPGFSRAEFFENTKNMFANSKKISLAQNFGNIYIYKVDHDYIDLNYIYAPEDYITVKTKYNYSSYDSILDINSDYYYDENGRYDFIFAEDDEMLKTVIDEKIQNLNENDELYLNVSSLDLDKNIPHRVEIDDKSMLLSSVFPVVYGSNNERLYNPNTSSDYQFSEGTDSVLIDGEMFKLSDTRKVLLLNPTDTFITSFNSLPTDEVEYNKFYSVQPVDCGGFGSYGKDVGKGGKSIILKTYNNLVCLPLGDIPEHTDVVVKVSFEYSNTPKARLLYCIYNSDTKKCLNERYKKAPDSASNKRHYEDYSYIESTKDLEFGISLETWDFTNEQLAEVQNIKIEIYDVVDMYRLQPPEKYFEKTRIVLESDDLPLQIESPDDLKYSYLPGSTYYNNESNNCDNFNGLAYNREFSTTEAGIAKYTYSATDAISCDNINLNDLSQNASYVFTINSKVIENKGLDLCIAGFGLDKCLIRKRLEGGIENIILPSYSSSEGYNLSFGNQSIGREDTVNELYSVDVKYLPYMWLKDMYLDRSGEIEEVIINPIRVDNVLKANFYKYNIGVDSMNDSSNVYGLMILNQTYHEGWTIYIANSCLLNFQTPLTCKKADIEHVLAKNWANGWLVPNEDAEYVIIFWPQYLQFIGYFILVSFMFVLGIIGARNFYLDFS